MFRAVCVSTPQSIAIVAPGSFGTAASSDDCRGKQLWASTARRADDEKQDDGQSCAINEVEFPMNRRSRSTYVPDL